MIRCGATSRPVATRACASTIAHDVTIMATAISSQTGMAACVATSAAITITAAMMTATTSAAVGLYGITIARSVAAIDLNPRKAGTHVSLPPVTVIEVSGAAIRTEE